MLVYTPADRSDAPRSSISLGIDMATAKGVSVTALNPAQQRIHEAALKLFAERGVTQVNVKELAQAAGVARGTIYNNLVDPESLFEEVAAQLAHDMNERATDSFRDEPDPAKRLAFGIRQYVRRAHEDPHWGRFLTRFAFSATALQHMWQGQPFTDLMMGVKSKRYRLREDQAPMALSLVAGAVLGAMFMVLEGVKTWREAGSDAAELVLTALGLSRQEARKLATAKLPALPSGDRR